MPECRTRRLAGIGSSARSNLILQPTKNCKINILCGVSSPGIGWPPILQPMQCPQLPAPDASGWPWWYRCCARPASRSSAKRARTWPRLRSFSTRRRSASRSRRATCPSRSALASAVWRRRLANAPLSRPGRPCLAVSNWPRQGEGSRWRDVLHAPAGHLDPWGSPDWCRCGAAKDRPGIS